MLIKNNMTRKVYSFALIFFTITVIVIIIVQHHFMSMELKDDLDQKMILYLDSQMERISTIDRLYYAIEISIEPTLKDTMNKMQEAYRETGSIEFNYEQLKSVDDGIDVFVIDRNFTIIESSDPIDKGLVFDGSQKFIDLFDKGEYLSERVSYQTRTLIAKKYVYQASYDGKYVFEVGYDLNKFDYLTQQDSLETYSTVGEVIDDSIIDVHLHSYSLAKSFNTQKDIYKTESQGIIGAFEAATLSKEHISYIEEEQGYQIYHLFKTFYRDDVFQKSPFLVVELEYSNKSIIDSLNQQLLIKLGFTILIAVLILIFQLFINSNFLNPINQIIKGINKVKNEDFGVRVNIKSVYKEVLDAGNNLNLMIQKVENLLNEEEKHNELLSKSLAKNKRSYFETIRAFVNAIDAKDGYTAGHCERVTELTRMFADSMNLSESEKENLRFGSMLHDIGKIGISDHVLDKPGILTDDEYNEMKTHPLIGYKIIEGIDFNQQVKDIVKYHHERIDGRGYPEGLKGDDIPLMARMVVITDAFDAMTSKRHYRNYQFTAIEAFDEMRKHSGTQFDKVLLETFISAYINF